MNNRNIVAALAVLLYAAFLAASWTNGTFKYYAADAVFSAAFILFLHSTYKYWRLTLPVYTLLALGFASHLMGIFGWYSNSPLPVQWDHVTHGFPLFAFALFLFNFATPWMDRTFRSKKTIGVLAFVLLATLGIGAIIENIEFAGFLAFGFGQGALFMGGPGDGLPDGELQEAILEAGGGYWNTEMDLVWNALGAIAGIALMSIVRFRKPTPSRTA
jgi:uncharacterized membrane protein YjdF